MCKRYEFPAEWLEASALPNEVRTIEFSAEELVDAIAHHLGSIEFAALAGYRPIVRVTSETEHCVRFALLNEFDQEMRVVELEPTAVAAALIKWCAFRHIPVPRQATKAIRIKNGNVVLLLRLSDGVIKI